MAPQTLNTTRDVHYPQQDAHGGGNIAGGAAIHEGNTKLLPWLMLTALVAGVAGGISIVSFVLTHGEMDRQYRQIQEYRIRTEDAENSVVQVNPNFHPKR